MPKHQTPRRYRGSSSDERKAERRVQLIAAGLEVIGNNGYKAATVRAICSEAGLTERYFYESFANREALFCAVYQDQVNRLRDTMLAAVEQAERKAPILARAWLSSLFGALQDDPRLARIILFEIFGVSDTADKLYQQTMFDFALLLNDVTRRMGVANLSILPDEEMVATGLVGAVVQIAIRWVLTGYHQPMDTVVESCLSIIVAVSEHTLALEAASPPQ